MQACIEEHETCDQTAGVNLHAAKKRVNRKLTFRTHQVATFPLWATDEPNRPDGERP